MEASNFQVKSIPRHTFFEVYDELSHRDWRQEANSTINIQERQFNPVNPFIENQILSKSADTKSKFIIPPLNLGISNEIAQKTTNSYKLGEENRKKPPAELIAIEIPLNPEGGHLDISSSSSSRKSPAFNSNYQEYNYYSSKNSEISNDSLYIPKIPKSIQSLKSYSPSENYENMKKYMTRLHELDSGYTENEIILKSTYEKNNKTANYSLISILKECKVVEFLNIINDIMNESYKNNKKTEGCLIKCSRKVKINEEKRLEFLFHAIGSIKFDITKLLHRNILRRYLFSIEKTENIPETSQWNIFGFRSDPEEFFQKSGSPLALIVGVYVIDCISKPLFQKFVETNSSFLEITLELALESFKLSKLSKIKKNHFTKVPVKNYFRLTAAAVINWFNSKISNNNIDDYELTQQVIEKMRDHTAILLDAIDGPMLSNNNLPY